MRRAMAVVLALCVLGACRDSQDAVVHEPADYVQAAARDSRWLAGEEHVSTPKRRRCVARGLVDAFDVEDLERVSSRPRRLGRVMRQDPTEEEAKLLAKALVECIPPSEVIVDATKDQDLPAGLRRCVVAQADRSRQYRSVLEQMYVVALLDEPMKNLTQALAEATRSLFRACGVVLEQPV